MKRSLLIICIALLLCVAVFHSNLPNIINELLAGAEDETQGEVSNNTQTPSVDNNSQTPENPDEDNVEDSTVGDTENGGNTDEEGNEEGDVSDGNDTVVVIPENVVTLTDSDIMYGALANEITIGENYDYSAILPANVKIASGVTSLELTVSSVENDGSVSVKDGEVLTSLDVHIEGISLNNNVPMLVKLGPVFSAGLKATELKLYHTENGIAVPMTRVNTINDFAIHNQYTYDALTGEVCIFVSSFSVFSAVQTSASVWDGKSVDESWYDESTSEFILEDAADFVGFRNLVDKGTTFAGKTVKLGVDIDLDNILFDPIGFGYYENDEETGIDTNTVFMGTFDGQNHTIYNLYQNGWELDTDKVNYSTYTYNTAGGGLFASIKNATVKNIAVSGANIVFECIDMGIVVGLAQGICHFENIVVTNSKIANYNRATGAVVGEVCYGPYGTDVTQGYSHTFKNITVDSSVKVSSLWGSFDTICGGVIGGKWNDATVMMENVTVAAELDVFSDVTSAYQWYAYRRCGMLIGHTEQNSPKQALNAAAEFLTCENVNVYYGDWVNYTYYEYKNQDSDTGKRYPWVRAEAGEHNEAFSNPRYGVPTHDSVKVSGIENSTANTTITFGQLYGGGQGIYGCNEHTGVTTYDSTTKTIYIENNLSWTDLKLQYWFSNGEDRWSTFIEGMDMSSMLTDTENVYKVSLPAYASGFMITGTLNSSSVSTPEYVIENLVDSATYKINALDNKDLTISVDDKVLTTTVGNWSYNIQFDNTNVSTIANYDVLVYRKGVYTGSVVANNVGGVAVIVDKYGIIRAVYDGNGHVLYNINNPSGVAGSFTYVNYASYPWNYDVKDGETLVIFPRYASGATDDESFNYAYNNLRTKVGQYMTFSGIDGLTFETHECANVCASCSKCANLLCNEGTCAYAKCDCNLEGNNIKLSINGKELIVESGKYLYNTAVTKNTTSQYEMIIYNNNYTGSFETNEYGVALVFDAKGNLIKGYAWDGYYTAKEKISVVENVITIEEGTSFTNATYATVAFDKLQDGETLIIFPNITGSLSTDPHRSFAKNLCDNYSTYFGESAVLEYTATSAE